MSLPDPSRQPDVVAAFLAAVPPFDRLPPDERAILAAAGRVELGRGFHLCRQARDGGL